MMSDQSDVVKVVPATTPCPSVVWHCICIACLRDRLGLVNLPCSQESCGSVLWILPTFRCASPDILWSSQGTCPTAGLCLYLNAFREALQNTIQRSLHLIHRIPSSTTAPVDEREREIHYVHWASNGQWVTDIMDKVSSGCSALSEYRMGQGMVSVNTERPSKSILHNLSVE